MRNRREQPLDRARDDGPTWLAKVHDGSNHETQVIVFKGMRNTTGAGLRRHTEILISSSHGWENQCPLLDVKGTSDSSLVIHEPIPSVAFPEKWLTQTYFSLWVARK